PPQPRSSPSRTAPLRTPPSNNGHKGAQTLRHPRLRHAVPIPRPEAEDPCRSRSCLERTPVGQPYSDRTVTASPTADKQTSLWLDTAPESDFPGLDRPLSVDVAVLGGGIVGISTALLLKRAGMTVAVVEADRV